MKRFCLFTATLLLIQIAAFAETHVDGNQAGVWDVNGSPYVVDSWITIADTDTLYIQPGVTIFMAHGSSIEVYGAIYALGTQADSIRFLPLDGRWWADIGDRSGLASLNFDYCLLNGSFETGDQNGVISAHDNFSIRNCTFEHYANGIAFVNIWGGARSTIQNCRFGETSQYAIRGEGKDVQIFQNVFERVGRIDNQIPWHYWGVFLSGVADGFITVRNCLFIDSHLYANAEVIAYQNIFLNDSAQWIQSPWGNDTAITYVYNNCFIGNNPTPFTPRRPPTPDDLGVVCTVNRNGDSTDAYGNLYLDPRILGEGGWPDRYRLLVDSPCIDAGSADSPLDPDSTIADIGPFFHPLSNIAFDTFRIRFDPIPIGTRAVLPFSIRNNGLDWLQVFMDETELRAPFYLFAGEDTIELAPGAIRGFEIEFNPTFDGEFNDSVLIHADDRHDSLTVLYITAEAYNSVTDLVNPPFSFFLNTPSPNPFNSSTTIRFELGETANETATHVAVYGMDGRLIAELLNEQLSSGDHALTWNAGSLAAGVYWVRLESGTNSISRKVILMR